MKRLQMPSSCLALFILAIALGGCGDNSSPTPAGNLSLTIASPGAAKSAKSAKSAKAAAADTFTAGGDTLVVTAVQVVLKKVELQASDDAGADSVRVEEFEAGPMLVDLPLGGAAEQVLSVDVTPGTYNQVEFKVHAVQGDDASAAAFQAAHPEFVGVSIRVAGSFNGTAFTFTSDLDSEQENDITPPLVVTEGGGAMNLTLRVDHTAWFTTAGGGLVDPATAGAGGPNQGLVEENIKQSFDSFEDDNQDGHEDGGGHGF